MLYSIASRACQHSRTKYRRLTFGSLFGQLISPRKLKAVVQAHRRSPAGVRPRVGPYDLILGMVFHALLPGGLLSTHIEQVTGKRICDSSASQRRQCMGWEPFVELLDSILSWMGVEKLTRTPSIRGSGSSA